LVDARDRNDQIPSEVGAEDLETKTCPACKITKPLSDFVKNRSRPNGYGSYCRPCNVAVNAAYVRRRYGGYSHYRLMSKYGIGRADVDAMIEVQGGMCPICERRPAVHVDHDHRTGRVREILCELCNGALGAFRDDPSIIARAIAYLEAHHADD
jgi:formate dehydrogenase maturation protein FdhE